MSALLLVAVCLGAGVVAARAPHPPQLVTGLNWWVLFIALPALVLGSMAGRSWQLAMLWPALAMWLVFLGAWLLLHLVGRALDWSRGRIGALVLTAGLGNTAFVGYPLIEALRGREALPTAVIADQLGSFLVLSSLGVVAASIYAGSRVRGVEVVRRIAFFPAFPALLLALLLTVLGLTLPSPLHEVLRRLGETLTPVALFSVGLQLQLRLETRDVGPLLAGLGWKLLLAPATVLVLLQLARVPAEVAQVSVLQAAMAPMITAGILAQQHGLAPRLANRMVGVGILLSLCTVPLWQLLMTATAG